MKKTILTAVLGMAMLLVSTNASTSSMLQIKGSDTLINLVQRLAEEYMADHPGKYIAVTGGGSGTGVAALINDKCDIANSSRIMKPKEVERAKNNGVTANRVIIALDGLSVIINPKNVANQLTVDQIGAIFRGDIQNWNQVGGADRPITLYGRQSNSGTFIYFQDNILKGDYSSKMNRMNGNAQIVEAIKQDVSGIGYVGVGYLKSSTGLKVVKVAAQDGDEFVSPLDLEAVKAGKYPISRPLNQYVKGDLTSDVKDFLEYELSARGQEIVEEEGFFPISNRHKEMNKEAGL